MSKENDSRLTSGGGDIVARMEAKWEANRKAMEGRGRRHLGAGPAIHAGAVAAGLVAGSVAGPAVVEAAGQQQKPFELHFRKDWKEPAITFPDRGQEQSPESYQEAGEFAARVFDLIAPQIKEFQAQEAGLVVEMIGDNQNGWKPVSYRAGEGESFHLVTLIERNEEKPEESRQALLIVSDRLDEKVSLLSVSLQGNDIVWSDETGKTVLKIPGAYDEQTGSRQGESTLQTADGVVVEVVSSAGSTKSLELVPQRNEKGEILSFKVSELPEGVRGAGVAAPGFVPSRVDKAVEASTYSVPVEQLTEESRVRIKKGALARSGSPESEGKSLETDIEGKITGKQGAFIEVQLDDGTKHWFWQGKVNSEEGGIFLLSAPQEPQQSEKTTQQPQPVESQLPVGDSIETQKLPPSDWTPKKIEGTDGAIELPGPEYDISIEKMFEVISGKFARIEDNPTGGFKPEDINLTLEALRLYDGLLSEADPDLARQIRVLIARVPGIEITVTVDWSIIGDDGGIGIGRSYFDRSPNIKYSEEEKKRSIYIAFMEESLHSAQNLAWGHSILYDNGNEYQARRLGVKIAETLKFPPYLIEFYRSIVPAG